MYISLHVKCLSFLSDFTKTNFLDRYLKIIKHQISRKSVKWKPSSMRTDITKLIVAFRNFAKAPKSEGNRPFLLWSRGLICDYVSREGNCQHLGKTCCLPLTQTLQTNFLRLTSGYLHSKDECSRFFQNVDNVL